VGSLPCGALLLPSRLEFAVSCVYIPRTTDAAMLTIGRFVRSRHEEYSQLRVALPAVSGTRNRIMFASPELIMERQEPGEPTRGGRQLRTNMEDDSNSGAHTMRPTHNDERVREPLNQDYEGLGMLWIFWFCDMA